MWRKMKNYLLLAIAVTVSTALLYLIGAPSASLFGGLIGSIAIALLVPDPPSLPSLVSRAAQATIGVIAAAGVNFAALAALGPDWPWILLAIGLTLIASVLAGLPLTRKGTSTATAVFASIAGGAAAMTAIAQDFGADQRIIVVVQYFRLLLVLATLPVVITQVFASNTYRPAPLGQTVTETDLLFVLVAVTVGPLIAHVLRIPSAPLLGALGAGIAMKAFGAPFDDVKVPALLTAVAMLVIGVQAGIRFTPETVTLLRKLFPTVLISTVLILVFCAVLSIPLAKVTGTSALDAYLATSPGGLPVILATASEISDDFTFVSAVQVLRLLAIIILVPIAVALFRRYRRGH